MNLVKNMHRLRAMNALIYEQITGTPIEFAKKIGVSRRQLYRLLELLISLEAPVSYSRKMQSFYYSKPYDFEMELKKLYDLKIL